LFDDVGVIEALTTYRPNARQHTRIRELNHATRGQRLLRPQSTGRL
jgi:hypothetical protein